MSDIFHSFHVSPTFVCITQLDYRAVQIYVGTWRISEQFLASTDSLDIDINFYFFAMQHHSTLWVRLLFFPKFSYYHPHPQISWYGENVVMEIKRIIADAKTGETLTTFRAKKAPREFLVWDLWGRILQEVGSEQNTRDLNHFWSKYADIFMFLRFLATFSLLEFQIWQNLSVLVQADTARDRETI